MCIRDSDISYTMVSRKLKKVLDIKKLVYSDNYDMEKLKEIVKEICNITPVSYTHLDVYKRQV